MCVCVGVSSIPEVISPLYVRDNFPHVCMHRFLIGFRLNLRRCLLLAHVTNTHGQGVYMVEDFSSRSHFRT